MLRPRYPTPSGNIGNVGLFRKRSRNPRDSETGPSLSAAGLSLVSRVRVWQNDVREATVMAIKCATLLGLALCATIWRLPVASAADEDARPLSSAQIALFESDHLGGIRQAERLEYRFAREAAG